MVADGRGLKAPATAGLYGGRWYRVERTCDGGAERGSGEILCRRGGRYGAGELDTGGSAEVGPQRHHRRAWHRRQCWVRAAASQQASVAPKAVLGSSRSATPGERGNGGSAGFEPQPHHRRAWYRRHCWVRAAASPQASGAPEAVLGSSRSLTTGERGTGGSAGFEPQRHQSRLSSRTLVSSGRARARARVTVRVRIGT